MTLEALAQQTVKKLLATVDYEPVILSALQQVQEERDEQWKIKYAQAMDTWAAQGVAEQEQLTQAKAEADFKQALLDDAWRETGSRETDMPLRSLGDVIVSMWGELAQANAELSIAQGAATFADDLQQQVIELRKERDEARACSQSLLSVAQEELGVANRRAERIIASSVDAQSLNGMRITYRDDDNRFYAHDKDGNTLWSGEATFNVWRCVKFAAELDAAIAREQSEAKNVGRLEQERWELQKQLDAARARVAELEADKVIGIESITRAAEEFKKRGGDLKLLNECLSVTATKT